MNGSIISVTQKPFGSVDLNGVSHPVTKFILENQKGGEVHLISYGAAVTSIIVPDKIGQLQDVVLGFDDLDGELLTLIKLYSDTSNAPLHNILMENVRNK